MNVRSERVGVPELQRLGRSPSIPVPSRAGILRELHADVLSLTEELVARGTSREEAWRRATELLVPDEQTLRSLEALHEPLYVRLTRRIDPVRLRRIERRSLAGATAVVIATSVLGLARAGLVDDVSAFQWPVMVLGAGALTLLLAKAFQLWIKGDHSRPGRGLGALLLLATAPTFVAAIGGLVDFHAAAGKIEASPERLAEVGLAWGLSTATLVATGLLFSLSAALGWFATSRWVAHIEQQQQEIVGLTGPLPNRQGDVGDDGAAR